MPDVKLSTSTRDGHVVVALCGELEVTDPAGAEAAVTALMARAQSLIIDMPALDFMDCAPLGVLLRGQGLARRGGDVVLAAPQPHARRFLALTGKEDAFWVEASVPAGIASRRTRYAGRRPAVSTACPGGRRRCVLVPGDRGRGSGGPGGLFA